MSDSLKISIDNKVNVSDTSCDLTQTTPVIRPWYHVKPTNTDNTEEQGENEQFTEAEDYDEDLYNSSDLDAQGLPATPSRLLTITSTDFGDSRHNDLVASHASASENEDENSVQESPKYCNEEDDLDLDLDGRLAFDDMDRDLRQHDDIITDHMNKLNLAAQMHFSQVIQRLIKEKHDSIRSRDEFYTEQMRKQQGIIDDLTQVLTRTEIRCEHSNQKSDTLRQQLATRHIYWHQRFSSPYSLYRVFHQWRTLAIASKQERSHTQRAILSYHKRLLQVTFKAISKESNHRRLERTHHESKSHYEEITQEMIVKYEKEISTLQAELREAQGAIRNERHRRQQLEEDLRRMFLKNMTVMNMEALSLFQDPQSYPPQMVEFGPTVASTRQQEKHHQKEDQQRYLREEMKSQQQILRNRHQEYFSGHRAATKGSIPTPTPTRSEENMVGRDGCRVINVSQKSSVMVHQERVSRVATTSPSHTNRATRDTHRIDDTDYPEPRAPLRNKLIGA